MKRFKSIITSKSWVVAAMASLLLVSGCGPVSPPVWPPDAGSYVDLSFGAGTSFTTKQVPLRYWLRGVGGEAGGTGQEAAIWALGNGCGTWLGMGFGPNCFGVEKALYVLPSDSGATVVVVTYVPGYISEGPFSVDHASHVTLERKAGLIRAEFWATRQEYELQEEEFIPLGSRSKPIKLRFQLDMEPGTYNVANVANAIDELGPVIQHVLGENED